MKNDDDEKINETFSRTSLILSAFFFCLIVCLKIPEIKTLSEEKINRQSVNKHKQKKKLAVFQSLKICVILTACFFYSLSLA